MSQSATHRVASHIGCVRRCATAVEIENFEERWGLAVPAELKKFWQTFGTGRGFVSSEPDANYLALYSPLDALAAFDLEGIGEYIPDGCAPFGDNGSGEMIVFVEGKGFGLLSHVHDGLADFCLVSRSLDGFFKKTEAGEWFSE